MIPAIIVNTPVPKAEITTVAPPSPEKKILTLWVPPFMDPGLGTPESALFKEQLNLFTAQNPGVQIVVRIKSVSGPGGMLDTLTTANEAASMAKPSLVALSRADFETAAAKKIIFPLKGQTGIFNDNDWYPYGQQLSLYEDTLYGLPFAGDAMSIIYRPASRLTTPIEWRTIFSFGQPLIFAAADSDGTFTQILYQAAGGEFLDDQNQPILQTSVLEEVLKMYESGAEQGVFPFWLTQYENDDQAWGAFQEQRANWVVTWSSRYLSDPPENTSIIAIPSVNQKMTTVATGWIWAVTDPITERRETSIKLAEFLLQKDFLSKWTSAAGYLPTRQIDWKEWKDIETRSVAQQIVQNAQIYPGNDLLSMLGPIFQEATLQVIKLQNDPAQAAESALQHLTGHR